MNNLKKIIIWGHPLYSHTHSYINAGFYKAFKYLGYDIYWFHDADYPKDFDYNNAVFFTEGFADRNIPIIESSIYIVHCMPNPAKYINKVKRLIDMRWCDLFHKDHVYEYTIDKSKLHKVGKCVYFEPKTNNKIAFKNDYHNYAIDDYDKIYFTWATNLLPHEVRLNDLRLARENVIHFCGNLSRNGRCENYSTFKPFIEECQKNNIQFVSNDPWDNPLSDDEVKKRVQKSILGVDIRGPEHVKNGYVPCRIFKNISYGHLGMTNSEEVYKELEGHCIFNPDPAALFHDAMSKKDDLQFIEKAMYYVSTNHTYVHRIASLIGVLNANN